MLKVGITGGIGSGKSTVSSLLQIMDIPVYIADIEGKRLTDTSPAIRSGLIDIFGSDIYSGGKLDRSRLASIIFNDKEMLAKANEIIHPEVRQDFLRWTKRQTAEICAIETAILFESGFHNDVDTTIMVYAPVEIRILRTMKRDNSDRASVERRINSQMSDEEKMHRAAHIIYNDDKHEVICQLNTVLDKIMHLNR